MKKVFAIIGAAMLVLLYIMTLIFAIIDSPFSRDLFRAAIVMTILVPILIFAIRLIRNVLNLYSRRGEDDSENGSDKK